MPRKPTIRRLAQELRLAPSTVSDALRDRGRVSVGTRRRVCALAKKLNYRTNPLTSTVLSEIRRTKGSAYHGTIATLDLHEATHWPHGPFPTMIIAGARARAEQMGFSVEEFVVGSPELSLSRLQSILRSRGIHGLIVLPSWIPPDLSEVDWSRYAGIYTDVAPITPALHSVCSDHYGSIIDLLERLLQRGYRRPGLIMEQGRDARIQYRQTAAFQAFQCHHPEIEPVPLLLTPGVPDMTGDFKPWLRLHQPDVVLGHFFDTPEWIKMCTLWGCPPADFVLLNVLDGRKSCAAIDLQPHAIGARAAELLVGQILRNDFGLPEWPSRNMIPAKWVEGPTVRPAADS